MKKIIIIAILLVSGVTSAQIKLSGVVKDSLGTALEMANVVAIDTVAKKNWLLWLYGCKRIL